MGGMASGGAAVAGAVGRTVQNAAPATGNTVVIADGSNDVLLWLSPAATIASCTVQLPSDASSGIGQQIDIGTAKIVTLLTVTGATTIYNALTTLQVGDLFTLKKVAANTWARAE